MSISFVPCAVSSSQCQNNLNLPADRQPSTAPEINQASHGNNKQDDKIQALTERPVPATGSSAESKQTDDSNKTNHDQVAGSQLSEADKHLVNELRARDRQVRAHEQAHLGAAGGLANSGPSYTTQRGPDGHTYAVGGEVSIDTSTVTNDPEATIQKAQQIRRAALAPADPSAQDLAVAAQATAQEQEARAELSRQRSEQSPAASQASSVEKDGTTTNDNQSYRPESIYQSIESKTNETSASSGDVLDLFA